MKKIILCVLMCVATFMLMSCSCAKKEEIKYSAVEAKAEGNVTLDSKEPKINISNIKAKKGADIDYLSGVVVENEDEYDDFKIWVDASAVDIDEPGDYKAKYTFEYDGKSFKYEIIVTILDEEVEASGEDVVQNPVNDEENNVGNNEESHGENNSGNTGGNGETKPIVDNGKKPTSVTKPSEATEVTTTKKNDSNSNSTTVTTGTKPPSNSDNSTTQTTKREMITSSGSNTTQIQNIGYSYIELLSGSTISIKCTTAKYIVSTRTDVSYTTKNNVKYKVSKLIITYNTGDERTLETVEEKCK